MTTWIKFSEIVSKIVSLVKEGIRTFDISRRTCLQTDWSKDGIGYLLLQQYCECNPRNAPVCCPDGWRLIYAGSRFTTPTEAGYSPTEGESLAVAWALDNARMFVLGCKDLIVSTDHKPLLRIFCDRDLSRIPDDRISSLKEKTFHYQFQYNFALVNGTRALMQYQQILLYQQSPLSASFANQHQLKILTVLSLFRRSKMHTNQTNLTKNSQKL